MALISKILFIILFVFFLYTNTYSQTKRWSGLGGDGKFENPANWEGNILPGVTDAVIIPANTPTCKLPDGTIRVSSITIAGQVESGNTTIKTSHLDNMGTFGGENSQLSILPPDGEGTNLDFHNNGGFHFPKATVYLGTSKQGGNTKILNTSEYPIQTRNLIINADEVTNNKWMWADYHLSITSNQSVYNMGLLGSNSLDAYGGVLEINTPKLTNIGTLQTGSSHTLFGGEIKINAGEVTGNGESRINSALSEISGDILIAAEEFVYSGGINTHYTLSKTNGINIIHPGNVELAAKVINMPGDRVGIWAKNLTMRGENITIQNPIHQYFIDAQEEISFYTTEDGFLDLSGVQPASSISADSIKIFSDNIITPAGGLNSICRLPPQTFPSDTNSITVELAPEQYYCTSADIETLTVHLRNTSMTAEAFTYDAASLLNWSALLSGVTNLIEPFATDSIYIPIVVPDGLTESSTDTITIQISVNGNIIEIKKIYVTYPGSEVIPVELISFNAELENEKVVLRWTTGTETNNLGFEIERSQSDELLSANSNIGGRNNPESEIRNPKWCAVGFVKGMGTTANVTQYSFTDNSSLQNGTYKYKLKQIDMDGTFTYSNEVEIEFAVNNFSLEQNYPNPFNPITIFEFRLHASETGIATNRLVVLKVFDVIGNEVATVLNQEMKPGYYKVQWNANGLASGLYFYSIYAKPEGGGKDFRAVKKMLIVK